MANASTPYSDGQVWDAVDANWVAGFGDGTDGAFSETGASTTNLVQGTIYQYTSFNLGSAHTISASSTSDKPIIIYVQGNCTIDGTIDLTGLGATTSYQGSTLNTVSPNWGTTGTSGNDQAGTTSGGFKGLGFMNFQLNQNSFIMNGLKGGFGGTTDGSGGAGGSSAATDGSDGSGGSGSGGTAGIGGDGGCTIILKIGGTLTFGASSSIDVSGADGTNASVSNAGGGGGGGSGDILIFHRGSKTDNGVTTDVTGGSAGSGFGSGANGGTGAVGTEKISDWATILW